MDGLAATVYGAAVWMNEAGGFSLGCTYLSKRLVPLEPSAWEVKCLDRSFPCLENGKIFTVKMKAIEL